jgi:hypothetical protein
MAELIKTPDTFEYWDGRNYDVHPDGEHFVFVKRPDEEPELRVVLNWVEELKRKLPL